MACNPIYVALDMTDSLRARQMADELRGVVGGLKIGLACWYANGPAMIRQIVCGFNWFLDVKLLDIPEQVAGAVRAIMPLSPTFLSIHETGGQEMMKAAITAARTEAQRLSIQRPKLLAVTTLTSLPATNVQVYAQAHHAVVCGLDGAITSAQEVAYLRRELGPRAILMTPGIRLPDTPCDDHERTATPKEAMDAGANWIVVGRPITQAANPREAAKTILASLA